MTSHFKYSLLATLILCQTVRAEQTPHPADEDFAEFSATLLMGNREGKIDTARFAYGNAIPAGEYEAEIYVNEQFKGMATLHYLDNGDHTALCLTPALKALLDLKAEAYTQTAPWGCMQTEKINGNARFDLGRFRFDVEIPQALTESRPQGYISPSRWQTGVPALFVNYYANHYRFHSGEGQSHQTYLNAQGGVNIGGWAIRHSGSWEQERNSRGERSHSRYSPSETYAKRGFAAIEGELTLGDFYSSGHLLEGIGIRGASLASDERMLPYSQRGYAPVVQGVANSNAKITVRQGGSIIRQTVVPAGAFIIDDLYPNSYSGDLTVEITESDGSVRQFVVPYSSVAQQVRKGHWRYQLNAGLYRYGNDASKEKVLQGALQYGLSNMITLNSATNINRNYHSILAGVGIGTPIGAFSGDATYAVASLPYEKEAKKGYSLNFNYSLSLTQTGTSLTLAAYRYSSREFYTLTDTLWFNDSDGMYLAYRDTLRSRPKSQMQLVINQILGQDKGTLFMNASRRTFWNSTQRINQFQINYANRYKKLNYRLGFSHTYDSNAKKADKRGFVNFSIPLGESRYAPSLSTSFNSNGHTYTASTSLSGSAKRWSYGVSQSLNDVSKSISGNVGYNHRYITVSSTASKSGKQHQYSLTTSGAVVLHPKGVTLANRVNDSFAIVHAKGAEGAIVGGNTRIDRYGNAIISDMSPYEINRITLDPEELPINVELSATSQEFVPHAGSAMLADFKVKTNAMLLFDLKRPNGDVPPMSAEAYDHKGRMIGYVTQGGRLFAGDLDTVHGIINVVWGSQKSESCAFTYSIPHLNKKAQNTMDTYSATCH